MWGVASNQPRGVARKWRNGMHVGLGGAMSMLLCGVAFWSAPAAEGDGIPNFAPEPGVAWVPDRPTGDDFLPPLSGPGPVMGDPKRPYVPNGGGRQPTYRIADTSNPILKPWVVERMKKSNDEVDAGKVPYITRERCWPAGVPGFTVYTRVQAIHFLQTPKKVTIVNELNAQVRNIYMNVPHTANPKPSWYGESVGRYEGDELVVDTIGLNDRTYVDNYRTPHTTKIHVVERFKTIDGGSALLGTVTVDDPDAFNMPWTALQRWRRVTDHPLVEQPCAENNFAFFDYDVVPIPEAKIADF
jgi:hypothetical protein